MKSQFEDIFESQVRIELVRGYRLEIAGGRLTILSPDGQELLGAACASASFTDAAGVSTTDPAVRMQGGEDEIRIEVKGDWSRPGMEWRVCWERRSPTVRIYQTILYTTEQPIHLDQLVPLDSSRGFAQASPSQVDVYNPGYMSWSAHTLAPLDRIPFAPDNVLAPMVEPTLPDGIPMPWVAHLSVEGTNPKQMLIGFTESKNHVGVIEMGKQRSSLLAWNDGEGIALQPGERRQAGELILLLEMDRNDALAKYAFEVARRRSYRKKPSDRPPQGWCSWSAFFENVTWQDIQENLKAAWELKARFPVDYFQLDDFYTRVGDWLDLRDELIGTPSPAAAGPERECLVHRRMQGLSMEIRTQGLVPGLWLAPLLVNAHSKLFQRLGHASDWFIRGEDGQALNSLTNWGGPNYALDVTNPAVEEHLRRVLWTVTQVWGFKLLKLDFLYAGALHGHRHNPNMTSVEAYNRFLQIVREEAADARIIFCGAPFIESAGGDYIRIGPDVADRTGPEWYPPNRQDRACPAGINSVTESLTRAFWLETLYGYVDSDSIILRLYADSKLSPAERETIIASVRATNSVVSLGDDLRGLTEQQKQLVHKALSPACQAARPIAFDEHGRPSAMQSVIDDHQQEITLVNWKDQEEDVAFDPDQFDGLRGWHYALQDVMHDEWLGVGIGEMNFTIPAHGCKVLRVLKVSISDDETAA
ncbi:MAG: glycoside hydrolase family 36 protein [Rudaea sp.]